MSVPFAAARLLAGAAVILLHTPQAAAPRSVTVDAERFSFTPSRIHVTVGEEIDIHLRSADTAHGFKVEGTDINVEIPKRGKGEIVVRYKAAAAGRFRFECSRMCGAGHDFMHGEIVVDDGKER
ncbi:MAG TPA: cupredoxin domain-containing protein [Vicinamibacterales bacterium]|nr:cupredoxin domain-containing protein [Vicinamibacterales bacterium]